MVKVRRSAEELRLSETVPGALTMSLILAKTLFRGLLYGEEVESS